MQQSCVSPGDKAFAKKPEELSYCASRIKLAIMLLAGGVLIYCGYGLMSENKWIGIAGICLFGCGMLIAFVYFVQPRRYTISANADGITLRTIFKSFFVPWSDIDNFFLGGARGLDSVAIAYRVTAANRPFVGTPALFTASASTIVDAFNEYMKHAAPNRCVCRT